MSSTSDDVIADSSRRRCALVEQAVVYQIYPAQFRRLRW